MRAFAGAIADGDLAELVAVLDPDVIWTTDGGGRATAARKPLHGADRVARALAGAPSQAGDRAGGDAGRASTAGSG